MHGRRLTGLRSLATAWCGPEITQICMLMSNLCKFLRPIWLCMRITNKIHPQLKKKRWRRTLFFFDRTNLFTNAFSFVLDHLGLKAPLTLTSTALAQKASSKLPQTNERMFPNHLYRKCNAWHSNTGYWCRMFAKRWWTPCSTTSFRSQREGSFTRICKCSPRMSTFLATCLSRLHLAVPGATLQTRRPL